MSDELAQLIESTYGVRPMRVLLDRAVYSDEELCRIAFDYGWDNQIVFDAVGSALSSYLLGRKLPDELEMTTDPCSEFVIDELCTAISTWTHDFVPPKPRWQLSGLLLPARIAAVAEVCAVDKTLVLTDLSVVHTHFRPDQDEFAS